MSARPVVMWAAIENVRGIDVVRCVGESESDACLVFLRTTNNNHAEVRFARVTVTETNPKDTPA